MAEVLSAFLQAASRSRQSVEHQMGFSAGYLSKILGGTVELRMRHVFLLLEALGVDPGSFFTLAFPPSGSPEQRWLVEAVRRSLGLAGPPAEPAAPGTTAVTDAGLDEAVRRSLLRLLTQQEPVDG